MSFPAQRSNAIYGDANAQTATVVPDLAAAADGVNFSVTNDSGILNVNQQLVLQDFIYSTTTEEVYASVLSPGHVAIIGNTMGWTDKQKMVLELDVNFTLNAPIPSYPQAFNIPINTPVSDELFNISNVSQTGQPDSTCINMPNFNMLQPIDNVIIQMGDNNQVIGRSQMNYLNGIKMVAQDNKLSSEDLRELVNLGSPVTHSPPFNDNVRTDSTTSCFLGKSCMRSDFVQWHNTVVQQMQEYIAYKARGEVNPSKFPTTTFRVGIPLKFINSFFREPGYLPPGLRYRIEVNYNTGNQFFMDWNRRIEQVDITQGTTYYGRMDISYGTDMRLVYRRSDLRQPAAAAILNQWITRPFLYMYNTYEYVEIPTDGATQVFTKDIAISQQRPTSIFIKVLPDSTGNLSTTPKFRQLTIPRNTTGVLTFRNNSQLFARDFANSDCAFIQFSEIKINIAGRENYYLKTRRPLGSLLIPSLQDGTEMLNHMTNKNVDQELDEAAATSPFMVQSNEGGYLQISINPGDFQKNGYMSSDTGATVIRVTFTCTNATSDENYKTIPLGYKIVIYKKLQEEIELDGKKDITTISWPAVKSNSNYLIQNTYNLN